MKVLVVGCGKVGSEIARDLASSSEVDSVAAADASPENLKKLRASAKAKIQTQRFDISQKRAVQDAMRRVDLVCGALPGRLGFQLMEQAVEVGRDLVDISYTPQDPLRLHKRARDKDCLVVPQCGVAPGFTNMCVGDASRRLGELTSVRIFVGGLPQRPEPPLNYRIVFSLEDVINEYSRPVSIVADGRGMFVEPLSGRGLLNFPGVGRLEYFLTDGLGSLPRSFPKAREMYEFTLRYPGHADMMNTLRLLGFFERRILTVNGVQIEPRKLSLELLKGVMSRGQPEDLLALRVEVRGRPRDKSFVKYQILDYYDRVRHVSAMARTTAYPCTSVALLVGTKRLNQRGVVPPEEIAADKTHFSFIMSRLNARGIKLRTTGVAS